MVKLTPELIQQSAQFTNCVKERELDLRGYKIPVIENLGASLDQFDCIDFSDNDIRKLDGFPLLKRLKTVILNNNRVVRIGEELEEVLPNLETLILTYNLIQELGDIDNLASLKELRTLSLLRNPLAAKKYYRKYVIYKIPQLRLLDFRKIKMQEREAANQLFKSKKGKLLEKELSKKSKTFVPGAPIPSNDMPSGPTPDQIQSIKAAIANATSLEEVDRLNQMLKAGQIPGKVNRRSGANDVEEEEMEYEQVNGK